jgi:hypothetical protein
MLLRALASGSHSDWTANLVLLVAPVYNADGNEAMAFDNRPLQHGPVGGMGQRRNAQDLDLNRDHTKLESPEARALIAALDTYDPDVIIDLHTTNGTQHGYHLTYAPPLHPATHPIIDTLLRDEWLPAVTRRVTEAHGWHYYYYGNIGPRVGPARGWRTFDHRPRFNNNYAGLRNRFGILSEAYSYATFEAQSTRPRSARPLRRRTRSRWSDASWHSAPWQNGRKHPCRFASARRLRSLTPFPVRQC